LLMRLNAPATGPGLLGWNATVGLYIAPAATRIGNVFCPVSKDSDPVSSIGMDDDPLLPTEIVADSFWPSPTEPESSEALETTSVPEFVELTRPGTVAPYTDGLAANPHIAANSTTTPLKPVRRAAREVVPFRLLQPAGTCSGLLTQRERPKKPNQEYISCMSFDSWY
jgi:hypothetical protein